MLAVAATCLIAALAAPTAGAASAASAGDSKAGPVATSSVTKKRLARDIRSIRRRANRNRRNIIKLNSDLSGLAGRLTAAITGGDKTIDDKINAIVGVVTPVLTRLGDAAVQLEAGLRTLASETTKGFDTVKAGFATVETNLRELATFAQSQEYGIIGVFAAPGGGATCCRLITTGTADIPDDGNPVTAGGTLPIRVGDGTGGTVPPNTEIFIHAAIRSAEGDGTGADDPAGQVGGLLTVKCAAIGGCGDLPIGPGGADVAIDAGSIVCAIGPTPASNFPVPGGPEGGVPLGLVNVPVATERTDQTQPAATTSDKTVNPLGAASTPENDAGAAGTADPAGNSADKRCTLPNAGTYEVNVETQFIDLPTSEDPAADD